MSGRRRRTLPVALCVGGGLAALGAVAAALGHDPTGVVSGAAVVVMALVLLENSRRSRP